MKDSTKIKIDIQSIELSKFNPRFTFLEKLELNLIDFIQQGNKEYEEYEVALSLLKNEGNLKDMFYLMQSIVNSGWIDLGEKLIVVKKKEKNSKYIVAEGNRRLYALKLLFKLLPLPKKENLIQKQDYNDEGLDDDLMGVKSISYYYNEIQKLISNYDINNKNKDINLNNGTVEVELVDQSSSLWTLLYTKHISGERPGMRRWKRGKYFVDILNFFPKGIDLKDKELATSVSINLRRDINAIFKDFIQAQFIRDMFQAVNNDIEKTKKDIAKSNVSALESGYSIKHIRNITKKEMNFTNEIFEDMFKFKYEKNSGIIEYNYKINITNFFKLIIKFYKKGVLKTRPINDDDYNEIAKEVIQIFSNNLIDINSENNNKSIEEQDIFSLTINQIDNILITSPNLNKQNIKNLKMTKELMQNDLIINNNFKKIKIKNSIFFYLNSQLKHNALGPVKYSHAQAFTIRTMMETFFTWGIYFSPKILNKIYNDFSIENAKIEHVKRLSSSDFRISKIAGNAQVELEAIDVKEILESMCTNVDDNITRFFLEFFNQNFEEKTKSILINSFIHAYHRHMNKTEEQNMIKEIILMQKNVLKIIQNINLENINILNDKINIWIKSQRREN